MNKRGFTPLEIKQQKEYNLRSPKGDLSLTGPVRKRFSNKAGFTLVEILISIALLVVGVVLLINALVIGTEGLTVARRRIKAIDYAQEVMEKKIVGVGFGDLASSPPPPVVDTINNFTWSYEVWYVTATNLEGVSASATDYKRVKVIVKDNLGIVEDITLETLRTNY